MLVLESHCLYLVSSEILSVPDLLSAPPPPNHSSDFLKPQQPSCVSYTSWLTTAHQKVFRTLRHPWDYNGNSTLHRRKMSLGKYKSLFEAQRHSPAEKKKTFPVLVYGSRSWSFFLQGNLRMQCTSFYISRTSGKREHKLQENILNQVYKYFFDHQSPTNTAGGDQFQSETYSFHHDDSKNIFTMRK